MKYVILFDCHWDDKYPVPYTCGEFSLEAKNDLEVIYYIKNHFLDHRNLCGYNFIISNDINCFEIKLGA